MEMEEHLELGSDSNCAEKIISDLVRVRLRSIRPVAVGSPHIILVLTWTRLHNDSESPERRTWTTDGARPTSKISLFRSMSQVGALTSLKTVLGIEPQHLKFRPGGTSALCPVAFVLFAVTFRAI